MLGQDLMRYSPSQQGRYGGQSGSSWLWQPGYKAAIYVLQAVKKQSSKAGRGFAFHNGMLWFEYEMSPNKLLCLGVWSPAGGAVLGVGGTFWTEEAASSQMWDHVGCT